MDYSFSKERNSIGPPIHTESTHNFWSDTQKLNIILKTHAVQQVRSTL